jgi:Class III cytochrome C family
MRHSFRKTALLATAGATCGLWLAVCIPASVLAADQPPDTIILKGSPMGGVKFEHKLHVARADNKCETCHHPSKPEKPAKAAQEPCMDCHTRPPQPGMKTGLPGAFHNPAAQSGTCIDCHKRALASGKKPPTKCLECHKRENG